MKKRILTILAGAMLILATNSFATPILNTAGDSFEDRANGAIFDTYQNSGQFLFIEPGNTTPFSGVQAALNAYLIANSLPTLLLTENPNITITGTGADSGTWTVAPTGATIDFYVVKASNAYAMYQVLPADGNGSWSTFDLWDSGLGGHPSNGGGGLEISHFVGYNSDTTPVPEPGTMMLLGAGFLGLAVYGKRRRNG